MNDTILRKTTIWMMDRTFRTLNNIISEVSQEDATTYRDGGDGWTTLEVLCHLRDFDGYFYGRAVMMLEQDTPQLPAYDHELIAIENDYNAQDLQQVLQALKMSRERFIMFFKDLPEPAWERNGVHPERESFTMTDAAMQVATHDITHIEQITKILHQKLTEPMDE